MSNLEAALAVQTLERALRQLMAAVYPTKFGDTWMEEVASPQQIEDWKARAATEERQRGERGIADTSTNLLDYSNLHDLIRIIEKNKTWEPLVPALKRKSEVLELLRRVEPFRNPVAHYRELVPFERDLLSGVAGDIRNRVAVYMNGRGDRNEFYARIDYIADSFGRVSTRRASTGFISVTSPERELAVGDQVTFQCRASDGQSRPISWRGYRSGAITTPFALATGDEVELQWTVREKDVGDSRRIIIQIAPEGAAYFRNPGSRCDDQAIFTYHVTPPRRT